MTRRSLLELAFLMVLGGAIGYTSVRAFGGAEERPPVVLHVPVRVAVAGKPEAHRGIVGNLVAPPVKPETVYVSEPGTDLRAGAFCAAAVEHNNAIPIPLVSDSSKQNPAPAPAPSPLVLDAGRYSGRRLELYGFHADGSAYRGIFRVRAPLEFGTGADTAWVRRQRGIHLDIPKPLGWALLFGAGVAAGAAAH